MESESQPLPTPPIIQPPKERPNMHEFLYEEGRNWIKYDSKSNSLILPNLKHQSQKVKEQWKMTHGMPYTTP